MYLYCSSTGTHLLRLPEKNYRQIFQVCNNKSLIIQDNLKYYAQVLVK